MLLGVGRHMSEGNRWLLNSIQYYTEDTTTCEVQGNQFLYSMKNLSWHWWDLDAWDKWELWYNANPVFFWDEELSTESISLQPGFEPHPGCFISDLVHDMDSCRIVRSRRHWGHNCIHNLQPLHAAEADIKMALANFHRSITSSSYVFSFSPAAEIEQSEMRI